MMKSTLKNKGILYIVLLALVVLAYLFSDFATKDSEDEIAAHIQMQLQSDDLLLDEIMLDLQEVLLINGQQAYEQKSLDYQRKYKDRFAFFLYHDHQLELWTDNHIPLPINDSLFTHQKLQQFGSYQLLLKKHEFHHFNMMGLQVLKLKYPWQNDYLTNHIAPYFKISSEITVDNKDGIPILDNKGNSLFFITLQESKTSDHLKMLAFALFIASFFLLAIIISLALSQLAKKKALLSLIIFSMLLSFWFLIHRYLSLPNHLFNSSLFSSALYANASIQNSLGNLFFISLILLLIVIYYLNHIKGKTRHWGLIYLYLPLSYVLYFGMILILRSLVFDSQIPLNLHQIASLDNNSYIALTIIFINQLSWLILLIRWLYYFSQDKKSELHFWILLIILSLSPLLIPKDYFSYFLILQLFFSLILILVFYIQRTENRHYNLIKILLYIILFTSITTWYLNKLEDEKERQFRKTSAVTLDMENDPFLENYFLHVLGDISSDQQVLGVLRDQELTNTDDSLFNIINDHYFEKFKSTYNFNLIHCYENSVINIPPDETEWPCYKYFQQKVENAQDTIATDSLYLIEGSFQFRHYIGMIPIHIDSLSCSKIFIEFVSKAKPKEIGLPAILDQASNSNRYLSNNYSYALYNNGILTEWFGKYDYRQKLKDYHLSSYHDSFFKLDDYQHYIYSENANNVLILSLKTPNIQQELASYAFVFLLYSLLIFLFYSIIFTKSLQFSIRSFQGRLQYSMILLLLFSFILIGFSSLYYIYYLNRTKNEDILMEKAHSVLVELEHKIMNMEDYKPEDQAYIQNLLMKFSDVFFTDITLYTRDGKLLASSRPEVFSSSLLSKRMDANAFYQLKFLKNSYYIQNEKIGKQSYLSAYLPFKNQDRKSVAYLNLPYFAKQYKLEEEVSGLVVALLNIYLFLLFITITISVIISRYLSKPLQLIKNKISRIDLQHANEKIEWAKDDEIGELVKEYNRMVDELSQSAQQLAVNQRESAWREMAQQIAHEIKNPLTPMKLNVQYLQKAWEDGVEDYEDRMKRITKGLQEQIDVLSDIAGQFSTFAAIDKVYPEKLNIKTIVEDVIAIFKANKHIRFQLDARQDGTQVFADKNQMIRVFNNIYKNAVQAIGNEESGTIQTQIQHREGRLLISIKDNGIGIDENLLPNIFEPRFTTKTGGMGLGLSLVKKMLKNAGGSISVSSRKGDGSTFWIYLPLTSPEKL